MNFQFFLLSLFWFPLISSSSSPTFSFLFLLSSMLTDANLRCKPRGNLSYCYVKKKWFFKTHSEKGRKCERLTIKDFVYWFFFFAEVNHAKFSLKRKNIIVLSWESINYPLFHIFQSALYLLHYSCRTHGASNSLRQNIFISWKITYFFPLSLSFKLTTLMEYVASK